ncbi:MAG: hypothetical protein ACM3QU_10775 [Verrucomicrobiota bacterium]
MRGVWRREATKRTIAVLGALFALDVCLFALSGIPALRNADHGWKWVLGGVGWFGGLLLALVLIGFAVRMLVRRGIAARRAV